MQEANKKVSKPRKSRAVKDPLTVGRTKDLKAEDIQETAAPKPKKRKTVEKKKGKISTEDEEKSGEENAEEEAKPKKRKKNRRGPAGFALRGENVEDTPATRRARLKASLQKGKIIVYSLCKTQCHLSNSLTFLCRIRIQKLKV